MKILISLLVTVLCFSAFAEKHNRQESKDRLMKSCLIMGTESLAVKKQICSCILANFETPGKLNDEEMFMLAEDYAVSAANPMAGDGKAASALIDFDTEVNNQCIANYKWRMPKKPK